MPEFIEIDVSAVNRVRNELRSFASRFPVETRQVLHRWGQGVRGTLKGSYPPQAHYPVTFKSERQRRYVMMQSSQGKVPYKRTGRLGSSWSAKVEGFRATIRNSMPAARFVMGDSEGRGQAHHMRHWPLARDIVEGEVPSLRRQLEARYAEMAGRI